MQGNGWVIGGGIALRPADRDGCLGGRVRNHDVNRDKVPMGEGDLICEEIGEKRGEITSGVERPRAQALGIFLVDGAPPV